MLVNEWLIQKEVCYADEWQLSQRGKGYTG